MLVETRIQEERVRESIFMDGGNDSRLNQLLDRASKKEIVYWFIIAFLVIAIIVVVAWALTGQQVAIDAISVAGALSSILLAIVAIVYAFVQSGESARQNRAMQDVLLRIGDKVEQVNVIRDEIQAANREYTASVQRVFDAMQELKGTSLAALEETTDQLPEPVKAAIEEQQVKMEELEEAINQTVLGPARLVMSTQVEYIAYLRKTDPELDRDSIIKAIVAEIPYAEVLGLTLVADTVFRAHLRVRSRDPRVGDAGWMNARLSRLKGMRVSSIHQVVLG